MIKSFYSCSSACLLAILFVNFASLQEIQDDEGACSQGVFRRIEVKSFAANRHLRFNVSWEEALGSFDSFYINIDTLDRNCFIPSIYESISVNSKFLIEPSLEMENPVEKPSHGCNYTFMFDARDKNGTCYSESLNYTIPDCVDTVCHCNKGSPYNLTSVEELQDKKFMINFFRTQRLDLNISLSELHPRIMYLRKNATKHLTEVHYSDMIFEQNSLKFPVGDVSEGSVYVFYLDFYLDDCTYSFEKEVRMRVAERSAVTRRFIIYAVPLLCIFTILVIFLSFRKWPKIFQKFRTYLPFLPKVPVNVQTATKAVLLNEIENVQYIPFDFMQVAQSLDHYEIPRNKIVLKKEIGGGSFGKVYQCDFYPIGGTKCVSAAAKMPLENAPEEEIIDFLAEIKIMKKIASHGGHQNVINMLACVTLERPHLMVMELVPCGSLKAYLTGLRKEWEGRKRSASQTMVSEVNGMRRFFPDNMVVENYLNPTDVPENSKNGVGLKYSSISFCDNTGSSWGSGSYVTPDGLRTPSTPTTPLSPAVAVHIPTTIEEYQKRDGGIPVVKITSPPRPKRIRRQSSNTSKRSRLTSFSGLNFPSPNTPESITSSGLPSCTETLLTPLEMESPVAEGRLIELTPRIQPVLDSTDLENFALQLANGMAFLESIDVTHRDLAARNILIDDQKCLKISDFGMARVGVYIHNPQKRQPLRWMAPEAIEERKCNTKTDVWSFGVVLWEIGSLGAFPYGDLSNDMVLVHVRQGKRLEPPEMCTDKLYCLMQKCWAKNSTDRPSFNEIAKSLDENNGKIYVDFEQISPRYVFPPEQLEPVEEDIVKAKL